jgi:glycosyltransferase involved in cell wall biosynthesis
VVTIVIPAHNEERVIGRLLGQLLAAARPGEFDIVVVANGCTDKTAAVAASFGPPVCSLSTPVASKSEALALGNRAAASFPRIYVDADVEFQAPDVRALVAVLGEPGILCAAPRLTNQLEECPLSVRWYYAVWERLPVVRAGLFGRGVIGVNEAGYERLARLPPLLADDLAASLAFGPGERAIAQDSHVIVHPPRTFRDLLRIRGRAVMGVREIERTASALSSSARTRPADLLLLMVRNPFLFPKIVLFAAVTLLARSTARRTISESSYSTWLRDVSSRTMVHQDP